MRFSLFAAATAILASTVSAIPTTVQGRALVVREDLPQGNEQPAGFNSEEAEEDDTEEEVTQEVEEEDDSGDDNDNDNDGDDDDDDDEDFGLELLVEGVTHVPEEIRESDDPNAMHQWLEENGYERGLHRFLADNGFPDTGDLVADISAAGEGVGRRSLSPGVSPVHPRDLERRFISLRLARCIGAIAAVIGGGLIPVSKAIKIGAMVKKAGGVRKVARDIFNTPLKKFFYKGKHRIPGDAVERWGKNIAWFAAEFTGITLVVTWCFN